MKLHRTVAVIVMLVLPAMARAETDVAAMQAHVVPASGSKQEADICAAMSLGYEFAYGDDDDKSHAYDKLAHEWAAKASGKTGDELEDYLDEQVMDDASGLAANLDHDTLLFYDDYCLKAVADARKP